MFGSGTGAASAVAGTGGASITSPIANRGRSATNVNVSASGGSSVSVSMAHTHHRCGDDSPPPTLTSYTGNYLDDIPNTGVVRFNDANFLKNLVPGQKLNNEVRERVVIDLFSCY